MPTCPSCGQPVEPDTRVCRRCLYVIDDEHRTEHDAGRLGADDRGGGRPPEDPKVDVIPLTGGTAGGALGSALRALGAGFLVRPRKRG
jgi:hypothetical protein